MYPKSTISRHISIAEIESECREIALCTTSQKVLPKKDTKAFGRMIVVVG